MNTIFQDVRYAWRQLRKCRGFTASAIVVLALGIGATTGMLAIVQSVLLRPLNYRHPEQLMLLGTSEDGDDASSVVPIADLRGMQRNLRQFDQIAAFNSLPVPVQTDEGTEMLLAPEVSTNFFQTIGVLPALGRPFREGDDASGAGAAIVSHEFWQNTLHANSSVLGSKVKVNGQIYTIVGVMPPRFQFPVTNGKTVWTALQLTSEHKTRQGFGFIKALGRLRPGVTPEQARAEGEAFLRNRKETSDSSSQQLHFWVYPYQATVTGASRRGLFALLAACLVLLLISIVNAANLQIARTTSRQNEIAMRAALGATSARIVRQLMIESLLLALGGAGLGCGVAMGLLAAARHFFSHQPRFDALQFDPWAALDCLGVALVCGIAAAIAPSLHVLKNGRQLRVQSSASNRVSREHRLSGWMVTAEVALSTVLLIAAGLFLRTFRSLLNVPLGFSPGNVMTFRLWPEGGNTMPMPVKVSTYQRVLDRLEHLSNVEAAGLITSLPIGKFQMTVESGFSIPGILAPGRKDAPQLRTTAVSPDYFRAMGIPILAGRPLSANDTAGTEMVGVANRALVDKYMGGRNPIGQQIVLDSDDSDSKARQRVTVVGVAGNVIQGNGIGEPVEPELAVSFLQLPAGAQGSEYLIGFTDGFAVRTRSGAGDIGADIRAIVKSEAPNFALDDLIPLDQAVHEQLNTQRLAFEITSAFAWIAVLLSGAGLYAVLAFLVGQRIREMGIRLALGSTRGGVFALIVRQGLWMVGGGLITGCTAAFFGARWIRSFLYGVTISDPLTYALVAIVVALAGGIAILAPALRAASIEPIVALRYE